jgi:hypothetical protein
MVALHIPTAFDGSDVKFTRYIYTCGAFPGTEHQFSALGTAGAETLIINLTCT